MCSPGLPLRSRPFPARWLYDRRGSELFDEITRLPSYYPTRTETALLNAIMPEIARASPPGTAVVEFGAGSATKTPAAARRDQARGLCAGRHLRRLSARERRARSPSDFPRYPVDPVVADFARPFDLPDEHRATAEARLLPGIDDRQFRARGRATDLLRSFRDLLGVGSQLLIGMDRVKPVERLIAAYDDPAGRHRRVQPQPARADQPRARWRHPARRLPPRSALERHFRRGSKCTSWRRGTSTFQLTGKRFSFAHGLVDPHREQPQVRPPRSARSAARGRLDAVRRMDRPGRDFAVILAEALPNRFAP